MKKILVFIVLSFWFFYSWAETHAIKIISAEEHERLEREITRADAFSFFADYYRDYLSPSYMYIELYYPDVEKGTDTYEDLQVLVALDLLPNVESRVYPNRKIYVETFGKLSENILWLSPYPEDGEELDSLYMTQRDLEIIAKIIEESEKQVALEQEFSSTEQQVEIFQDVYKTLLEKHYDRDELDTEQMMYSAIQWLAEGTGDTYTTYFPPVESKSFQESIDGEYEWIGSYVEMTSPGNMVIVTPIAWGPAERAWLKWGDRVTHVDGVEITPEISLQEAISWIKWPKGTPVVLTILREEQELEITVIREKIVIQDIEYDLLKYDTFYIQVKNFWPHVFDDFSQAIEELKQHKRAKKLIIDVRNNPGGYLDQVSRVLSYFVPKGEATAIVWYGESDQVYKSQWYDDIDWSEYEIILLQNSGSASASEILVWTLKDYHPDAVIMWEKSFWKWSVQNTKQYSDGSTLKLTIAKWFTWKTRTGIDGIGITPDVEVVLDEEKFQRGSDNQLDAALKY